jgi:hypothetical protein
VNHSILKFGWNFHQQYSVALGVMVALLFVVQQEDRDTFVVARDYCNNLDVVARDDGIVVVGGGAAGDILHPF